MSFVTAELQPQDMVRNGTQIAKAARTVIDIHRRELIVFLLEANRSEPHAFSPAERLMALPTVANLNQSLQEPEEFRTLRGPVAAPVQPGRRPLMVNKCITLK